MAATATASVAAAPRRRAETAPPAQRRARAPRRARRRAAPPAASRPRRRANGRPARLGRPAPRFDDVDERLQRGRFVERARAGGDSPTPGKSTSTRGRHAPSAAVTPAHECWVSPSAGTNTMGAPVVVHAGAPAARASAPRPPASSPRRRRAQRRRVIVARPHRRHAADTASDASTSAHAGVAKRARHSTVSSRITSPSTSVDTTSMPAHDFAERRVAPVEVRLGRVREEELAAAGRARQRHSEDAFAVATHANLARNGVAGPAGAVAARIAALDAERERGETSACRRTACARAQRGCRRCAARRRPTAARE